MANPNPVAAGERPGATNIRWSAGGRLASPGACSIRHGAYAGSDPFNSDEAWSCLGAAQAQGAQYLIIPAKSFWWLDRYHKFREHVEARYPAIVRDESACIVFEVHESLAVSPPHSRGYSWAK